MKLLLALFVALCLAHVSFAQSISNSTSNCTVCPGIKNHWQASLLPSDLYVQVNESTFGSLIMNLEYANSTGNFSSNLVLNYHLFMKGSNLTSARLHVGLRCSTGPVVALLTTNGTGNHTVSLPNGGLFAEGSLSSWNLTGPLENFTIYDLIQEFSEGNVYINVTSAEFPSGLVRGQVQALQEDTPVVPEDLLVAVNCTGKFQKLVDYISANSSNCTAGNSTHHWNVTAELLNNRTCSNWTMDCRCQVFRTIARNCTYNCSRISEGSNCTAYCVRTSNSTFTTCPRNFTTGCNSTSLFLQRPVCECNARNCTTNGTCPGVRDSALAKDGSFTVFAMTDAALGWDEMTSFEPHVVEGIYHVSDFVGKITTLETLSGAKLIIDGIQPAGIRYLKAPRQHRVTVNGVPISHPRAAVAKNGILHGLGGVVRHQQN